jgi:rRNA biogenesis protein RRP5
VMSKLKPITSYEDAVEGLVTHGFITGFEDYGCFVSFYNDVKGLAHRKDLGIDAGVKADTVFEVGQSIKCRVLRCDSASCRLSLSFVTSSHRFVSSLAVDIECASLHLQTHLLTMIGRCYCIMNYICQTMQCD